MKNLKGFSLIELLIVVAIIAILAAIAVPNFLAAQTRSKVSRVMSDMRNVETALESYIVDKGVYPCSAYRNNVGANTWFGLSALTTPVSFVKNLPIDVFSKNTGDTGYGSGKISPFQVYTGVLELNIGAADRDTALQSFLGRSNFWLIVSLGPDSSLNTVNAVPEWPAIGISGEWDGTEIPDISGQTDPGNSTGALLFTKSDKGFGYWDGIPYDPSNGTASDGDIYRWRAKYTLENFQK